MNYKNRFMYNAHAVISEALHNIACSSTYNFAYLIKNPISTLNVKKKSNFELKDISSSKLGFVMCSNCYNWFIIFSWICIH